MSEKIDFIFELSKYKSELEEQQFQMGGNGCKIYIKNQLLEIPREYEKRIENILNEFFNEKLKVFNDKYQEIVRLIKNIEIIDL